MRNRCAPWMVLCALPAWPAHAISVEQIDAPHVILLTVDETDDTASVRRRIRALVDEGHRTALTGTPAALARVQPAFARVWPTTNTIVLDPGVSLGISGFDAEDEGARRHTLQQWPWSHDSLDDPLPLEVRALPTPEGGRHVEFSVMAESPSEVCRGFSRQMAATLFDDSVPTPEQRRAFRREVRRWCQYGNLSAHTAEPPQFTIEPFASTQDLLLTLVSEWALVRSEDPIDGRKASYLFWFKTMGEGAGTGFGRRHGTDAWYDPVTGAIYGLMDVALHSGWGPIEGRDVVTAWPLNSSFPHTGNVHVFRCDAPEAFRPLDCPAALLLRKLFPGDSVDDRVNTSVGESFTIGGDAKISRSAGNDGKAATSFAFGLNMARATTRGTQVDLSLVHARSNADTRFYRSTWFLPDIPAIQRWTEAQNHTGSLAKATGLAATLNPRYEVIWEMPLAGNAGRTLPYHTVYEAGWNVCINGTHCFDYRRPPIAGLPRKARVGWSDSMVINLPSR
jgi:hypothetical protein